MSIQKFRKPSLSHLSVRSIPSSIAALPSTHNSAQLSSVPFGPSSVPNDEHIRNISAAHSIFPLVAGIQHSQTAHVASDPSRSAPNPNSHGNAGASGPPFYADCNPNLDNDHYQPILQSRTTEEPDRFKRFRDDDKGRFRVLRTVIEASVKVLPDHIKRNDWPRDWSTASRPITLKKAVQAIERYTWFPVVHSIYAII